MNAQSLNDALAYIRNGATLDDINAIAAALDARIAEESARCALVANVGMYVALWNCDPSYLDNLRGTIMSINEDNIASVRLDPESATMLRFNLDAHEDGYVPDNPTEPFMAHVFVECCRAVDPAPAQDSEAIMDAFMKELAAL